MARALPIARVSRCVPPAPGMMPSLISGWPNCASSPATIMSHVIASSQPPPRQCPWTEAITGFLISHGVISSATSSVSDSCHASAFPRRSARAGLGAMS